MITFKRVSDCWEETKALMEALEKLQLEYILDATSSDLWTIHVFIYNEEELQEGADKPYEWTSVLPSESPYIQAIRNAFQPKGIDNPE